MKRTPNVSRWLEMHADVLTACRLCGHQSVIPIVSRRGSPRAMLVGQAPGQTETVDQRPFAGRARKALFRWLERELRALRPPGASSWIHQGEHARLVDDALTLLGRQFSALGITGASVGPVSPAGGTRERRPA